MMKIGYHASHEQFSPLELLEYVLSAEKAGFQSVLSSDHLFPWSESQGHSGFAWSWLGAAMQATSLPFGIVTVPGYRYHPAIIAQAAATLDVLYNGRFFLTMGSGEALNEHIIGEKWPVKDERNKILKESVDIIRRLFSGEEVTNYETVAVEQAKLYCRPVSKIPIFGAALTKKTAKWLGGFADGLITTSRPMRELETVVQAFREGGGDGKPMILKAQLSFDVDYKKARDGAHKEWRNTLLPSFLLSDLTLPRQFDAAGEHVPLEIVEREVKISDTPKDFVKWIKDLSKLGFEMIILHNVNREQERFIKTFGKEVLPYCKS